MAGSSPTTAESTKTRPASRLPVGRFILAALSTLFLGVALVSGYVFWSSQSHYQEARQQYADLREMGPAVDQAGWLTASRTKTAIRHSDLAEVNPDYIGWVAMPGTPIDYPLVQGRDNQLYLETTFQGSTNASGAIFLDSRCLSGLAEPLCIVYGHNMKDGSMLAHLNQITEQAVLDQQLEVLVYAKDGRVLVYNVFAVKQIDVSDLVYRLPGAGAEAAAGSLTSLDAPVGAPVLVLSTCTNSPNPDDRLVVLAALDQSHS
ncbi:MAG: class B sortase [Micrococcales bacterium]|nr:class B sortase [Micrococcales bacterium]